MKVRHFEIRLVDCQLAEDQNQLNSFLESVDFVKSDCHFVDSENSYWSVIVHYNEKTTISKTQNTVEERNEVVIQNLNTQQQTVYEALKTWRASKAKDLKIPTYLICHNSELLKAIVREAKTSTDLLV
ncbi:HRDC domain-containing protein [Flavobacterium sp. SM2513]|uniref:HRDC domain-containing protein n=1 Tax=Flavobacterium sp. SM2513 TaxID=3424766 RepID=UPI003D7F4134